MAPSRFHRPRLPWASTITMALVTGFCCCAAQAAVVQPPPSSPTASSLVVAASSDYISAPILTADDQVLLVDTRQPVLVDGEWVMMAEDDHDDAELRRRHHEASTTTALSQAATATDSDSTLPSPYDTLSAANFTDGPNGACAQFYSNMVNNDRFKACYPFSTLLEGSQSFFEAQKSPVSITQTLDASCAANAAECSTYLGEVAKSLISAQNCGADFQLDNSMVVFTHNALTSYQTVYSTTCLIDPQTSSYCFTSAVTNMTNTNNAYFYYLPLNMTLPDTTEPNCNWCLRQTMAIYQAQSANRKLAVATTYQSAAEIVNKSCGSDFANATLPVAILQSAAPALSRHSSWLLSSAAAASVIIMTQSLLFF